MLKLNVLHGNSTKRFRSIKTGLCWFLVFPILIQAHTCWQQRAEQQKAAIEAERLQQRAAVLEVTSSQRRTPDDFGALYGAIREKNIWIERRANSPLVVLDRFESNNSSSIVFKSIETDGKGGTIKLAAPDMDTAARFLNASIGNANVRINTDERIRDGVIVIGSWNE
ncbi:MAG TPA: hypothetical protein VIV61_06045 [Candidatus Ozemobacteraceae bacterium]